MTMYAFTIIKKTEHSFFGSYLLSRKLLKTVSFSIVSFTKMA